MFTIPNMITVVRIPLALAFLQENSELRLAALILAMLSDCLDGFIARKYRSTSRTGTFLDPFADKFFVLFVLAILLQEQRLQLWEALTMLCRDFSVFLFGIYLALRGTLGQYEFRAIICGKVMTALQFTVLTGLVMSFTFPPLVYFLFIFLGLMALVELYRDRKRLKIRHFSSIEPPEPH